MSDEHPEVTAGGQLPRGEPPTITPREQEILRLIAEGLTDQQIAERLWVSVHTARAHQAHLREKFQVRNRMTLVHEAERLGCLTKSPQESSIIAIGEGPHPGYTQGQEVAPKPSPEQPGSDASADAPGDTEMLNPRLRFWYLAALLAIAAQQGAAAAHAANDKVASLVARRIWTDPKADRFVSPSPDGRFLSFVDWETGDLALRDLATGKSRRLTNKGSWSDSDEWALHSCISPGGKRIAYVWWNKDRFFDLRLIDRDGARPRVLWRNEKAGWLQPVDWSPDEKQILAYLYPTDGPTQMVLVSVADGSVRVLKKLDQARPGKRDGVRPGTMSLSPDGRLIAFTRPATTDAPERDIFLLDTEGGRETPLVQHPADDFVVGWAPDGKSLLLGSDRTGTSGLWRVRIAHGKAEGPPELLKRDMGAWEPLGLTRDGALFYGVQSGMVDVYIATLDATTGRLLTPPQPANPRLEGSNNSPAWSPDGRHLAYLSPERDLLRAANYPQILSIRSVESGETREFPMKRPVNQPIWSPDGRSLLASGVDRDGRRGAFRIDTETGTVSPLVEPGGMRPGGGVWAPDGRALYYRANDEASDCHLLKVHHLGTGQESELFRAPIIRDGALAVSPDGRQVAFVAEYDSYRTSTIQVIPAAGGEARELFRARDEDTSVKITSLAWIPDGRELLFARGKVQGQPIELWRIPVAGGESRKLGLAIPGLRSLSVCSDGRRLAFAAGSPEFEIWVMENLFPAAPPTTAPTPRP